MESQSRKSEVGSRNVQGIAIAVVQCEGRYLVGQRPEGVPLAGMWEFPGGKIHPGETPQEAAARECLEETGLAVDVGNLLCAVDFDYPHGSVRLHFFSATPRDVDARPQVPFRWVEVEEFADLEFPPANREVLELLRAAHRQC